MAFGGAQLEGKRKSLQIYILHITRRGGMAVTSCSGSASRARGVKRSQLATGACRGKVTSRT